MAKKKTNFCDDNYNYQFNPNDDLNIFYNLTLDDEQKEFVRAIMNPDNTIVFCNAVAGTGKTTIAMGCANLLYKDRRNGYDSILYIVSPYGEQRQGYLPGSVTEKSAVYFEPAYQAMIECNMKPYSDIMEGNLSDGPNKNDGFVKMITHTFQRGTNLKKSIAIIDEAQNFTVPELKKVLTRCHDTDKVIVIGHTGQIDISGQSGFAKYIEHFEGEEHAAICKLSVNHRGWLSSYADQLEE